MKLTSEPSSQETVGAILTMGPVLLVKSPSGVATWHPAKLALVWLVTAGFGLAATAQDADLSVLAFFVSAITAISLTWRWLSGREAPRSPASDARTPELEIVECLVWASVAALRRIRYENLSHVQGSRIDHSELELEGFALVVAAVKFACDLILRDQTTVKNRIVGTYASRLALLVDPKRSRELVTFATSRIATYLAAVEGLDLEQIDGKLGEVWAQRFPAHDFVAAGMGTMIFGRLFKYAVSDVLRSALPVNEPVRITRVRFAPSITGDSL